ncbi:hypothetical protein Phi17218_106 [Cellulophaga phage phi17:2_18]|uniref:Uncharacterized protein n=2 Tax=Lightbulbvirus Cba172 TaxID=1918525 RepID=R9ZWP7_9CAUD|nr:hypothetical protein Phi17:2_gp106 [Cellulophaga phage phi17:2]AGO47639.1 hypothetical protein Phi17:2_gp106 [Cellulophaga phage phi17:2]ALO80509.1 hypothetical protein Phi17218_106 [Cellulophaga phage phi17:2_18]
MSKYKKKLKAFLEGLEMQDIDSLLEKDESAFKFLGEVMAVRVKTKQESFDKVYSVGIDPITEGGTSFGTCNCGITCANKSNCKWRS